MLERTIYLVEDGEKSIEWMESAQPEEPGQRSSIIADSAIIIKGAKQKGVFCVLVDAVICRVFRLASSSRSHDTFRRKPTVVLVACNRASTMLSIKARDNNNPRTPTSSLTNESSDSGMFWMLREYASYLTCLRAAVGLV